MGQDERHYSNQYQNKYKVAYEQIQRKNYMPIGKKALISEVSCLIRLFNSSKNGSQ